MAHVIAALKAAVMDVLAAIQDAINNWAGLHPGDDAAISNETAKLVAAAAALRAAMAAEPEEPAPTDESESEPDPDGFPN